MSNNQLPANVIAPPKGLCGVLGVPITVTCGPPTGCSIAGGGGGVFGGVAISTHESAAVTTVSPLDVLTSVLVSLFPPEAPIPTPDWPPNATLIVMVLSVRVRERVEPAAPVRAAIDVHGARDGHAGEIDGSNSRPNPRINSPLNHGGSGVCTRTLMPPKPLIAVLYGASRPPGAICDARMLPVSTRGDAASWMPSRCRWRR